MMHRTLDYVETLARVLRNISSATFLVLAIRFAWFTSADLVQEWKTRNPETRLTPLEEETADGPYRFDRTSGANSSHRPDLEQLKELVGNTNPEPSEPAKPEKRPRHLLVDLGPSRSVVYVNKHKVGRTPYGGKIDCADGEKILIQVLPPKGAPIVRTATCLGDSLTAVTGKR